MNMTNNTLKTGLIIATINVTIETLNASFPEEGRLLRYRKHTTGSHHTTAEDDGLALRSRPLSTTLDFWVVPLDFFGSRLPPDFVLEGPDRRLEGDGRLLGYQSQNRQQQRSSLSQYHLSRRLVYYADSVQPEIRAIIDSPFCPSETPQVTKCAVVTTSTCVFLEEGDDPAVVRTALRTGIQASIESGAFEEAIPEENRLP